MEIAELILWNCSVVSTVIASGVAFYWLCFICFWMPIVVCSSRLEYFEFVNWFQYEWSHLAFCLCFRAGYIVPLALLAFSVAYVLPGYLVPWAWMNYALIELSVPFFSTLLNLICLWDFLGLGKLHQSSIIIYFIAIVDLFHCKGSLFYFFICIYIC